MDLFTKDDLKILMGKREGHSVSIYMPTHRAGRAVQQDPIRFKNLIGKAEEQLLADKLRSPEVQEILEPARKLLTNHHFWSHQSDGLALFCSKDLFQVFRLPLDFDEFIVVTDRFHIKPLLPLIQSDGPFYILALSQNQIRLLLGTRFSVDEVELEGFPTSLAEALHFDDPEKQLQFQTGTRTPRGQGDRPAIFHGHGVGINNTKTGILRYFHMVDKGLGEFLHDGQAPLILAGVDYLLPIYREVNSYPNLLQESIEGNPEAIQPSVLHKQAQRLVRPHFLEKQNEALDHFKYLMETTSNLVSKDLSDLVPAAYDGRVETLFVALGTQVWGKFDLHDRSLHCYEAHQPNAEDLLDFVAAHSILNGGQVYALPMENIPGGALLAGILRYPYRLSQS